jgi:pimeloyl-ACP methyl ester carboxylesterase
MKKFFGMFDKDEETDLKEKLLAFSGVPSKYINCLDVYVKDHESMHVTLIDDLNYENKKDLVLIHGLAGSSVIYFKIFKKLSQYFRIYAVDLPGMGCSSRIHVEFKDHKQCEDYFLERLKVIF